MAQAQATSAMTTAVVAPAAAPTASAVLPTATGRALAARFQLRPAVAVVCWAGGLASWIWAASIAQQSRAGLGTVADLYLSIAAGAALLLVGTIARLPHGDHVDPTQSSAGLVDAPLRAADPASLAAAGTTGDTAAAPHADGAAPAAAPTDALTGDEDGGARLGRAARSAEEMVAAYKRAAEKHSEQARWQQQRAEAAEARIRELEAEIAGFEDGTTDAARVLHARIEAAAIVASNRRITEVTDASDRVIRALREEKSSIEADRQAARQIIEGLERDRCRMAALAASAERQRIQRLVRELVGEYAHTLPSDRARLARGQAEHFITAIQELPITDAVRMAEERVGGDPVLGGHLR